jgi:hypothetical protein
VDFGTETPGGETFNSCMLEEGGLDGSSLSTVDESKSNPGRICSFRFRKMRQAVEGAIIANGYFGGMRGTTMRIANGMVK